MYCTYCVHVSLVYVFESFVVKVLHKHVTLKVCLCFKLCTYMSCGYCIRFLIHFSSFLCKFICHACAFMSSEIIKEFLPARRYAGMVFPVIWRPSVHQVRSCTKMSRCRIMQIMVPRDSFYDGKDLYEIPTGLHLMGSPNAGEVKTAFSTGQVSGWDALMPEHLGPSATVVCFHGSALAE